MSMIASTSLLLLLSPFTVAADPEPVVVPGSEVQFPVQVVAQENGKGVEMGLTGVALRKKLFVSVYSMGSYLDKRVKVANAEELANADATKWLFMVMERNVSGADMATAIKDAIKVSHPDAFNDELSQVVTFFEKLEVKKGDRVWLAHKAGKGIVINVAGRAQLEVPNVAFAKAVWGIYLGPTPITDSIKQGLISRLW